MRQRRQVSSCLSFFFYRMETKTANVIVKIFKGNKECKAQSLAPLRGQSFPLNTYPRISLLITPFPPLGLHFPWKHSSVSSLAQRSPSSRRRSSPLVWDKTRMRVRLLSACGWTAFFQSAWASLWNPSFLPCSGAIRGLLPKVQG